MSTTFPSDENLSTLDRTVEQEGGRDNERELEAY